MAHPCVIIPWKNSGSPESNTIQVNHPCKGDVRCTVQALVNSDKKKMHRKFLDFNSSGKKDVMTCGGGDVLGGEAQLMR